MGAHGTGGSGSGSRPEGALYWQLPRRWSRFDGRGKKRRRTPREILPTRASREPSRTLIIRAPKPRPKLESALRCALSKQRSVHASYLVALSLTLTACSTGTVQGPGLREIESPRIETPPVPQMPAGLPRVCKSGECDPEVGDIIVPPLRWDAIGLYMDLWAEYPGQCRGALDDSDEAWQRVVESERRLAVARADAETIETAATLADTWPSWQAWLLAGVVGGVALVIGYVSGWVVGEFAD